MRFTSKDDSFRQSGDEYVQVDISGDAFQNNIGRLQ